MEKNPLLCEKLNKQHEQNLKNGLTHYPSNIFLQMYTNSWLTEHTGAGTQISMEGKGRNAVHTNWSDSLHLWSTSAKEDGS